MPQRTVFDDLEATNPYTPSGSQTQPAQPGGIQGTVFGALEADDPYKAAPTTPPPPTAPTIDATVQDYLKRVGPQLAAIAGRAGIGALKGIPQAFSAQFPRAGVVGEVPGVSAAGKMHSARVEAAYKRAAGTVENLLTPHGTAEQIGSLVPMVAGALPIVGPRAAYGLSRLSRLRGQAPTLGALSLEAARHLPVVGPYAQKAADWLEMPLALMGLMGLHGARTGEAAAPGEAPPPFIRLGVQRPRRAGMTTEESVRTPMWQRFQVYGPEAQPQAEPAPRTSQAERREQVVRGMYPEATAQPSRRTPPTPKPARPAPAWQQAQQQAPEPAAPAQAPTVGPQPRRRTPPTPKPTPTPKAERVPLWQFFAEQPQQTGRQWTTPEMAFQPRRRTPPTPPTVEVQAERARAALDQIAQQAEGRQAEPAPAAAPPPEPVQPAQQPQPVKRGRGRPPKAQAAAAAAAAEAAPPAEPPVKRGRGRPPKATTELAGKMKGDPAMPPYHPSNFFPKHVEMKGQNGIHIGFDNSSHFDVQRPRSQAARIANELFPGQKGNIQSARIFDRTHELGSKGSRGMDIIFQNNDQAIQALEQFNRARVIMGIKGSLEHGGRVPETGLYLVHQGEQIIPNWLFHAAGVRL